MKFITSNPGSPFWDLGVKFLEESLRRHGHELIVYTGGFSNAIRSATENKLGLFLYLAPWTLVKDNLDTLKDAPISRRCPLGVQAISEMAENYSVLFPEHETRLKKKDNWFGTQFLLTNTKYLTGLKEFSEFELNESFTHVQNVPTSVFTQPNQYTWPVYENEMLHTCFDFAMGSAIVNCWNREEPKGKLFRPDRYTACLPMTAILDNLEAVRANQHCNEFEIEMIDGALAKREYHRIIEKNQCRMMYFKGMITFDLLQVLTA